MNTILITGGLGFVMGNVVNALLSSWPEARIAVLDLAADDPVGLSFFGDAKDRIALFKGDVCDERLLRSISSQLSITHVIHGATITHDANTERREPRRYLDINLGGTVALLEWARSLKGLQQFIHVSTGGVYGNPTSLSPRESQPESGPFDPPELYAVSKYSAELVVRRFGYLYELPACRVRLSDIFGPMERPTGARRTMSLPYLMVRSVLESRPLRVAEGSLAGGGDFLSSEEAGDAFRLILRSDASFDVFNIASGQWLTLKDMLSAMASTEPRFQYRVVHASEAEVQFDPANRLARYNAYAIDRLTGLGWRARPFQDQLKSYYDWVMHDPDRRCPPVSK